MQIEKLYHLRHFSLDYEKWIFKIFVFLSFFQALSCQVPYNLRKTSICCCILTHIFFWLNTEDNAELYIIKSLNLSSTRKFIMNHRVHYFYDLGLSYFYRIKAMSLITADKLQWAIYVKTKSCVYMCMKKLSRPSNPLLGKWKCINLWYLYFAHFRLQVSITHIQQ